MGCIVSDMAKKAICQVRNSNSYTEFETWLRRILIPPIEELALDCKRRLLQVSAMKGIELVLLAVGAVAGALLRYKITASPLLLQTLSVNVLIVNVIGSFILGVFAVLSTLWNLDSKYSLLVAVGFCGSLTTMSSFALETTNMIDDRQFIKIAVNIAANVGLSIGSIFAGRSLATLFTGSGAS